jgi:sulfoxide reductase heme-binding subunit YedZ
MPWRDRHGRFQPLKAAVLAAAFIPGLINAFWLAHGDLGGRPILEVIHATGLWTVRILLISLAITPIARMLDWPRLLTVRRITGLAALAYGVAHLFLYVVDQNFALRVVASEIVLRFYLTIGFVALLGLGALGATSTDAAIRRMGRGWKRLHRLAYPIGALALLHYFIQSKANVSEPVFCAGLFVWLMLWRALPLRWRSAWVTYPLLAVAALLLTAGIEGTWYALATHIDPWRVLMANETIRFGLRPAHFVGLTAASVALILLARRLTPKLRDRSRRWLLKAPAQHVSRSV